MFYATPLAGKLPQSLTRSGSCAAGGSASEIARAVDLSMPPAAGKRARRSRKRQTCFLQFTYTLHQPQLLGTVPIQHSPVHRRLPIMALLSLFRVPKPKVSPRIHHHSHSQSHTVLIQLLRSPFWASSPSAPPPNSSSSPSSSTRSPASTASSPSSPASISTPFSSATTSTPSSSSD
jgi:hypothetical protein